MLSRPNITMGIRLLLALGALSLLALSGGGLWRLRSQMLEDRQAELRKLLDLTLSVARAGMLKAGGPASEAGRKAFFEVLQSARFGRDKEQNYIWAYDYDGVAKAHIDPRKLGQNRLNVVYANGVQQVKEYIRIAKSPKAPDLQAIRSRKASTVRLRASFPLYKMYRRLEHWLASAPMSMTWTRTLTVSFSLKGLCWPRFSRRSARQAF